MNRVDVCRGASLIGVASNAPYSVTWNSPPAGDHVLTARAWDALGNASTSAPVTVSVISSLWAGAAPAGNGWRYLPWFGFFAEAGNGWIYHLQHGWMYPSGANALALWLWTPDQGWLWTGQGVYSWMWRNTDATWVWYLRDSAGPRLVYNSVTGLWEAW